MTYSDLIPTESQKKLLLEWIGFELKCPPEQDSWRRGLWWYPDHKAWGEVNLDMNILTKYLLPKLDYIEMKSASKAPFVSVKIAHENKEYYGKDKNLAYAVVKAAMPIIAHDKNLDLEKLE